MRIFMGYSWRFHGIYQLKIELMGTPETVVECRGWNHTFGPHSGSFVKITQGIGWFVFPNNVYNFQNRTRMKHPSHHISSIAALRFWICCEHQNLLRMQPAKREKTIDIPKIQWFKTDCFLILPWNELNPPSKIMLATTPEESFP